MLLQQLDPGELDGIISMHLLESDSRLSGPTSEVPVAAGAGANDWFRAGRRNSIDAVSAMLARCSANMSKAWDAYFHGHLPSDLGPFEKRPLAGLNDPQPSFSRRSCCTAAFGAQGDINVATIKG